MNQLMERIARLTGLEAASLAVASALHFSGHATDAGIAEAIIGAVLLAGAVDMRRNPARGRTVGLSVTVFATAGFLVGLGEAATLPEIAYHLTLLPVLVVTMVVLWRHRTPISARSVSRT